MTITTPISNKKLIIRANPKSSNSWQYSYDGGKFIGFDEASYLRWKFGVSVAQDKLDALLVRFY